MCADRRLYGTKEAALEWAALAAAIAVRTVTALTVTFPVMSTNVLVVKGQAHKNHVIGNSAATMPSR